MRERAGTGLILAIESSCDETAAAVVRGGREALSNVVASQINLHANYGGVVPELASREHLRNIVPVVREAMSRAGVQFDDLDAVAVTEGPGLAGALLVGITYAKALTLGLDKPLIGVNHLEGHIHAVLMEASQQVSESASQRVSESVGQRVGGEAPLLALVVSGGHTHLYLAESSEGVWRYRNVGRTVDDAAGEAYDKVAKLLGLGYPGGPWIDALARRGNPRAVPFRFQPIKHRGGAHDVDGAPSFDFSFSGIKTAVLRYIETNHMRESVEARRTALAKHPEWKPGSDEAAGLCDEQTLDMIASFQYAVVGNLLRQAFGAAEAFGARGMVVSGGVAANSELRRRFQAEADKRGLPVAFPSLALSTDNAAMIAAAAWPKFVAGEVASDALGATPQLRLGGS
ncbi:tRNA (adenosine(37)-N6)-threonylcarbamoyltransferase complex transferase subunit TsaD [Edaphobacter aggregans]|uniref:tRNA (adenosine(37)-N6)-threonylcarbamoyltransferase complex transferase subunit TsaD n=1 Tax=Edaphobacter aggregans TaxID=570835 RepID=UPI0005502DEB|nr:tRNA (adenosine(37)-N6)-threonylcarbamoyltransferase complex transferase subunit TsaD [Edaphobacter aggregans]